ncbi:hypothetical protein CALCODRAFT_363162 [Calocera cornea HHB12733]|uniref:Uncharacterized protein n=1 Tax=Calocera cornea HHB12733 TaxID=1353952 RepID=A0A165EKE7_9BASI|nr:hypothetical protein CALCODRAFT_363162 [Calocera cornea HHB12733]
MRQVCAQPAQHPASSIQPCREDSTPDHRCPACALLGTHGLRASPSAAWRSGRADDAKRAVCQAGLGADGGAIGLSQARRFASLPFPGARETGLARYGSGSDGSLLGHEMCIILRVGVTARWAGPGHVVCQPGAGRLLMRMHVRVGVRMKILIFVTRCVPGRIRAGSGWGSGGVGSGSVLGWVG